MATALFAVMRTRGPAWQAGLPLEEQEEWRAHAAFMDEFHSTGFFVLAGPLEGTSDVLIIVRASGPDQVEERLLDDPWTQLDLLRTIRIAPWTLRIGSLR